MDDAGTPRRAGDNGHLDIVLLTLGDPNRLSGGYLYHRRMAEAAPQHQARITFVSFPERRFPLAALDMPAIQRRAMAGSTQILVLDSIAAPFLGAWPKSRLPLPLAAMLHQPPGGVDHGPVRTRLQALLDTRAYRQARLLLVASESLADTLIARGIAASRLRVVPPGRDGATAPAQPVLDLRAGRQAAFLCVANWLAHKGIHELLDAFALLPADAGTLHLAGDDRVAPRYTARLRARLAQPDLVSRVAAHGPLPREQLAALYAGADVFVLPSRRETYGTVYAEAMAAGLPVVGWDAGNLPYLIKEGREGFLLPPGDIAGLAAVLQRLAGDEALRQSMGQAARERARQLPTWQESADLFFGALQEALATG